MQKYDLAVFIGRFQPFHNGHLKVVKTALERAKDVCIIVGSCGGPRSYRNPFTFEERYDMIRDAFSDRENDHIFIQPQRDFVYNDTMWIENIQELVKNIAETADADDEKIALIGHSKDNSSFYLKLFPQWESINVENVKNISSTNIREEYFNDLLGHLYDVPESTIQFLTEFKKTEAYSSLYKEYNFVKTYKKGWEKSPYEPIFVTIDACVVQSGHVLLVQRKSFPGQGLWALPGGFLNPSEKIVDGVLRELREETKIKVPLPVLKGNIKVNRVFDDPFRSSRGRTITHAFLIHLPPDTELPRVKGADDAKKAKWVPLSEVRVEDMFEDHYHIITNLTSTL